MIRKWNIFVFDHHVVQPPLLQMDNLRPWVTSSSRVRIKIEVSSFVYSAKMNEKLYTTLPLSSQAILNNGLLTLSSENLVNLPFLYLATFEKWWCCLSCHVCRTLSMHSVYSDLIPCIFIEYPPLASNTIISKADSSHFHGTSTLFFYHTIFYYIVNVFCCRGPWKSSQPKYFSSALSWTKGEGK